MKYFDRYMRFKQHLGLTRHRGNSASYRLKPLLDVFLHGLKTSLSKMKTCIRQDSAIEQYTMAHPLGSVILYPLNGTFFEAAHGVMRSYNFLHVCQWDAFQYLWPNAEVKHRGPLQHSHTILFFRFHNPKELCGEGKTKKRASSFLPPPMSFIKFHFILLLLFLKKCFYLLAYLDAAILLCRAPSWLTGRLPATAWSNQKNLCPPSPLLEGQ